MTFDDKEGMKSNAHAIAIQNYDENQETHDHCVGWENTGFNRRPRRGAYSPRRGGQNSRKYKYSGIRLNLGTDGRFSVTDYE